MWISNIAAWQQSPVCHVPYERFFFMSVPTECSVSDVHWRRSLACVSARCTFVLFFVLNHYSGGLFSFCEGVCLCVFSPGEKGNYLAISVFIYNDWAFAIQIVSLYMEYEYIWLYMYETWMWLGFFVYCMTLLSYAPLKRSERGVFESRSPAALSADASVSTSSVGNEVKLKSGRHWLGGSIPSQHDRGNFVVEPSAELLHTAVSSLPSATAFINSAGAPPPCLQYKYLVRLQHL